MSRPSTTSVLLALLTLFCALLLAIPGRTVTTAYVNDLLIFLDGAHRVMWGQVPNRDFHTSLGPVVYLLPALGLLVSGSLGGAMPVAMGLLVLAFAPLIIHVLGSRLRPRLALPFGAFLILVLAAPINLGDDVVALSFAMFYNRVGWVALALLITMYLRPAVRRSSTEVLDLLCATLLVGLQLYLKVTYGLVALAFLVFMLFDNAQRRWAALSLLLLLIGVLFVELAWTGTVQHLEDLLATARVSGGRGVLGLPSLLLYNLPDLLLYAVLVGLALFLAGSFRDLLFFGFCVVAGLMIINQNAHGWGIITLFGGAAVAAEKLAARVSWTVPLATLKAEKSSFAFLAPGAPLLFLAMVIPTLGRHTVATLLHATVAVMGLGQPLGLPSFEQVRFTRLWSGGDNGFTELYVSTFAPGGQLLQGLGLQPERVLNLDFINPFSAGLGLAPPKGDSSWLHWGRNVDDRHFIPPETLFADVAIVMEPKVGINAVPLGELYGPYLADHYKVARETAFWRVHLREEP